MSNGLHLSTKTRPRVSKLQQAHQLHSRPASSRLRLPKMFRTPAEPLVTRPLCSVMKLGHSSCFCSPGTCAVRAATRSYPARWRASAPACQPRQWRRWMASTTAAAPTVVRVAAIRKMGEWQRTAVAAWDQRHNSTELARPWHEGGAQRFRKFRQIRSQFFQSLLELEKVACMLQILCFCDESHVVGVNFLFLF